MPNKFLHTFAISAFAAMSCWTASANATECCSVNLPCQHEDMTLSYVTVNYHYETTAFECVANKTQAVAEVECRRSMGSPLWKSFPQKHMNYGHKGCFTNQGVS